MAQSSDDIRQARAATRASVGAKLDTLESQTCQTRDVQPPIAEHRWSEDTQICDVEAVPLKDTANGGMITCPMCRYTYLSEDIWDVQEHRRRHDQFVHGVKAPALKTDRVLATKNGLRITVITPVSPLVQRQRAEKVARRAKCDTPFDFASYYASEQQDEDSPLVFLGTRWERAIAFLVLRRAAYFTETLWEHVPSLNRQKVTRHAGVRWAVCMIWVLAQERHRGLATQLLQQATQFVGLPLEELAWCLPFTECGERLARRHFPERLTITR